MALTKHTALHHDNRDKNKVQHDATSKIIHPTKSRPRIELEKNMFRGYAKHYRDYPLKFEKFDPTEEPYLGFLGGVLNTGIMNIHKLNKI